ncbi:uncharacterized protein FIBRA_01611 [Fibroporia radiculosa]|uniref:Uncharacterized protein n=1 Tax=Fibroporia radiculosa TaxID=599839 RepID=J4G131_9APHY|nr:uncharacterized protein FIBRA_01611 [Fibroporia radiculosa]CCL99593.1 predicted protein [Fibroporia radiculosa]
MSYSYLGYHYPPDGPDIEESYQVSLWPYVIDETLQELFINQSCVKSDQSVVLRDTLGGPPCSLHDDISQEYYFADQADVQQVQPKFDLNEVVMIPNIAGASDGWMTDPLGPNRVQFFL